MPGDSALADVAAVPDREALSGLGRLAPGDRAAVAAVLGLLVEAAGEDYGVLVASPVPL